MVIHFVIDISRTASPESGVTATHTTRSTVRDVRTRGYATRSATQASATTGLSQTKSRASGVTGNAAIALTPLPGRVTASRYFIS